MLDRIAHRMSFLRPNWTRRACSPRNRLPIDGKIRVL